jgi:hypothetical protein
MSRKSLQNTDEGVSSDQGSVPEFTDAELGKNHDLSKLMFTREHYHCGDLQHDYDDQRVSDALSRDRSDTYDVLTARLRDQSDSSDLPVSVDMIPLNDNQVLVIDNFGERPALIESTIENTAIISKRNWLEHRLGNLDMAAKRFVQDVAEEPSLA